MLIGYARVQAPDQSLDPHRDALLAAGCDPKRLYTDVANGAKADRPGLEAALGYMREGHTLVVWKLDRLGRSLKHLIETVHTLGARGVGFKSLQEHIDTTTSGGVRVFHLFPALAEFERDRIGEHTGAGLQAARARGRRGGRKPALTAPPIALARSMKADPHYSTANICATLKISKRTLYRYTGKPQPENRRPVSVLPPGV